MEDNYWLITTVDNPFNPFTQFDDWYAFDEQKGYHTSEYLARLTYTSDDLSDDLNEAAIDKAIDEIIEWNLLGIYRKYTKSNYEPIEKRKLSQSEQESLKLLSNGS